MSGDEQFYSRESLRLLWLGQPVTRERAAVLVEALAASLTEAELAVVDQDIMRMLPRPTACVDVSDFLFMADPGRNRDVARSFVYLAACQRDPKAMVALSEALAEEAVSREPRIDPAVARELTSNWLTEAALTRRFIAENHAAAASLRRRRGFTVVPPTEADERECRAEPPTVQVDELLDQVMLMDEYQRETAGQPMARVLDKIGDDPKGEWRRRFGGLLEPLPLLGGAIDPSVVGRRLEARFPWMSGVIRHVVRRLKLSFADGRRYAYLPPLLLVGSPGCGKTTFAVALAQELQVISRMVPMAGMHDSMGIAGASRGWASAMPSLVALACAEAESANPMLILDEMEKAGGHRGVNGSALEALVQVLEPQTSSRLRDPALLGQVNASNVIFVGTANATSPLPQALLDRLEVVEVPAPGAEHVLAVVGGLRLHDAERAGVRVEELPQIGEEDMRFLQSVLAERRSLRALKKAYDIVRAEQLDTVPSAPQLLH